MVNYVVGVGRDKPYHIQAGLFKNIGVMYNFEFAWHKQYLNYFDEGCRGNFIYDTSNNRFKIEKGSKLPKVSAWLAALSCKQKPMVEKRLLQSGFKPVKGLVDLPNPVHKRETSVTLYIKKM